MSERPAVYMALADRSESLLEVNLGSIQKDPEQRVDLTEARLVARIEDAILGLEGDEAIVIWVK